MSSIADSIEICNYHRDMIEMHGCESSYALGWKDTKSQQVRFKSLSVIADLNGCSILDAGCGYGDLLPYLSGIYQEIKYSGIEQMPMLIKGANKRYGQLNNANFIAGNFTTMDLPAADYVFASGSLNYRSTDAEFIYKAIKKLYAACNLGFAFNLLNDIVPNGLIVAYDPEQIIQYCSTICTDVKLVKNYDPDDFTVFMHKKVRKK